MATTASNEVIPGFGMGLITYLCDEVGPPAKPGERLEKSLEDLARFPLGTKLYLRVNWKDVQRKPGRLDLCEHWQIAFDLAKRYDKRLGLRVMMSNPGCRRFGAAGLPREARADGRARRVAGPPALRAALRRSGVPVRIQRADRPSCATNTTATRRSSMSTPRCTGSGVKGTRGRSNATLSRTTRPPKRTFVRMFEKQLEHWKKTPLATNTQPDFSQVGNFDLLERTVRSHNWLRTDTIFIENEQIEALSNRPAWTGVTVEVPNVGRLACRACISTKASRSPTMSSATCATWAPATSRCGTGIAFAPTDFSSYYEQYPDAINNLARSIGYRVRPSWVWTYDAGDEAGLILGLVNDGIAGVPGVLRISILDAAGRVSLLAVSMRVIRCRQSAAGEVPVAARHGLERAAREGRDRSERPALSGALGVQAIAQCRRHADAAADAGSRLNCLQPGDIRRRAAEPGPRISLTRQGLGLRVALALVDFRQPRQRPAVAAHARQRIAQTPSRLRRACPAAGRPSPATGGSGSTSRAAPCRRARLRSRSPPRRPSPPRQGRLARRRGARSRPSARSARSPCPALPSRCRA